MYRLFIALDLPDSMKDQLVSLCYGIPNARWSKRDQFHLTLKFIGDVEGHISEDIAQALSEIRFSPFEIRLSGLGHFPPKQDPKILWAGVEADEKLENLQRKIERKLMETGIEPDRRNFHPHITLAKLEKTSLSRVLPYLSHHGAFKTESISIDHFSLYQSHLSPKGSVYECLAVFKAGGEGSVE